MPIKSTLVCIACRVCSDTAVVKVADWKDGKPEMFSNLRICASMLEAGMEGDGDDFVCWRHGSGVAKGPEPIPSVREGNC